MPKKKKKYNGALISPPTFLGRMKYETIGFDLLEIEKGRPRGAEVLSVPGRTEREISERNTEK